MRGLTVASKFLEHNDNSELIILL